MRKKMNWDSTSSISVYAWTACIFALNPLAESREIVWKDFITLMFSVYLSLLMLPSHPNTSLYPSLRSHITTCLWMKWQSVNKRKQPSTETERETLLCKRSRTGNVRTVNMWVTRADINSQGVLLLAICSHHNTNSTPIHIPPACRSICTQEMDLTK